MPFIHDDFLLDSDAARTLYHEHAAGRPIYDYHCHLPPEDLAEDRTFDDLAEAWLEGDHYKWRAMRANGVPEQLITGDADPYDKFLAWARTVPATLRNPLYHWTHLELKRYFDIDLALDGDTAKEVWDTANARLRQMPVSKILQKFDVALICTTDDPADNLPHHGRIREAGICADTAVYPAFRPDRAFTTADVASWNSYIDLIAASSGIACSGLDGLLTALKQRHTYFHAAGCRLSDHGLTRLPDATCTRDQAADVFHRLRDGETVTAEDADRFTIFLMLELAKLDADRRWVRQLHLGASRNNNPSALRELGADTGYDSIGDDGQGPGLRRYLGALADRGTLPKTILYNLNPADNYLFASMVGNFPGPEPGWTQHGSGWWFLDQEEAMRWQINALSNIGLLSRFVGMLTDSRSFLSYPRHEYFRRVLCNLLGADIASGRLPDDTALVGRMVEDVCFNNARDYFGMALKGRHAVD